MKILKLLEDKKKLKDLKLIAMYFINMKIRANLRCVFIFNLFLICKITHVWMNEL